MPFTHRVRTERRSAGRPGALAALTLVLALPLARALAGPQDAGTPPAPATGTPGAAELRPHVVTYRVTFKGIGAGDLELRLARENGTTWRYETRPHPSFLARMVVSASSLERGTFRIGPDGVEPLTYSLDDGNPERGPDDMDLTYDRAAGRVRGYARGEPLDLPLVPHLQDPLSIRAAILTDLLAGREPGEIPMLDGREIATFIYHREGPARIRTALGEIDTVVYTSKRKGSDARAKTWKYWYAPSLGWLPVRIEQRVENQARIVFVVRAAQFP
jgi:hypothetical protein